MNIFISTNLYKAEKLPEIFSLLHKLEDTSIGIELFSEWQDPLFYSFLKEYEIELKQRVLSLHGPYINTEHSAKKGTTAYDRSMDYFQKTILLSQCLKAKYIVYHHNNCKVERSKKEQMIINSTENLAELSEGTSEKQVPLVIENAGVMASENMLFDENEFIAMAVKQSEKILIDIGHAHANGWDLERVLGSLAERISAYHVHNNDGKNDLHDSISEGTLDMDHFFSLYRRYTPQADLVVEYGKQCADCGEKIKNDVNYIKNQIKK